MLNQNCPIPGMCTTCDREPVTLPTALFAGDLVADTLSTYAKDEWHESIAVDVNDDLVELTHVAADDKEPLQGWNMLFRGVSGTAVRLDLAEGKLYVAGALTPDLIKSNFKAGATVEVGARMPDGKEVYFLELKLGPLGLEIEDLEATAGRDVVLLEMVAEIESHRYLSAETTD